MANCIGLLTGNSNVTSNILSVSVEDEGGCRRGLRGYFILYVVDDEVYKV